MELLEAIKKRHSVRNYTDVEIEGTILDELQAFIDECNRESGLNIQLCLNEPQAFSTMMAKFGKFNNVNNYLAIVGKKGESLEETAGYYGEKVVLKATQLGLNTCWVAMTYGKGKCVAKRGKDERVAIVITIGYGVTEGVTHKVKPIEVLGKIDESTPEWFIKGLEAAQLAPTAMNQQNFTFELIENKVRALPGGGFYSKIDLGIAKYHFEIGAGAGDWSWE